MVDQVTFTPNRALTANITASAGARARFYETGTTNPVVVYQDAAGSVVRSQPVEADASGVFPQVFYIASGAVKAVVTAADESALYTIDPVPLTPVEAGAASNTSFTPITGNPATTVQGAIENLMTIATQTDANSRAIVATTGTGNVYAIEAVETITGYADNQKFTIRINHENTDAATLNVDAQGPRNIQKYDGGSIVALAAGDLRIGDIVTVTFDGIRFVIHDTAEGIVRNYVAPLVSSSVATGISNTAGWAAYDGSLGRFFHHPTDGTVGSITTPDFEDGFEYLVVLSTLRPTTTAHFQMRVWRETAGAYTAYENTTADALTSTGRLSTELYFQVPRAPQHLHTIRNDQFTSLSGAITDTYAGRITGFLAAGLTHATAQKLLRAQFRFASGNIQLGSAFLYRRPSQATVSLA